MKRLAFLSITRTRKLMSRPFGSSTFRRLAALFVAAIALSGARLFAHDMWIEPATFSPQTGEIVGVRLRVGQDFLGDPLPRNSELVNQFEEVVCSPETVWPAFEEKSIGLDAFDHAAGTLAAFKNHYAPTKSLESMRGNETRYAGADDHCVESHTGINAK